MKHTSAVGPIAATTDGSAVSVTTERELLKSAQSMVKGFRTARREMGDTLKKSLSKGGADRASVVLPTPAGTGSRACRLHEGLQRHLREDQPPIAGDPPKVGGGRRTR